MEQVSKPPAGSGIAALRNRRTAGVKLVGRKECWVPTARGWLVVAAALLVAAALTTGCLYDFLSITAPVRADVLIVESWLSDKALRDAAAEFERGGYKYLMTCGPRELAEVWRSSSRYKTGPELAAAALTSMGLRTELIVPLAPSNVLRDRTYSAALTAAAWLGSTNMGVRAVNVYSSGPHARRFAAALSKGARERGESGGLRAFAYLLRPKGLVDDEQRLSRCD